MAPIITSPFHLHIILHTTYIHVRTWLYMYMCEPSTSCCTYIHVHLCIPEHILYACVVNTLCITCALLCTYVSSGTLPLSADPNLKVAVIGPNSNATETMQGNYHVSVITGATHNNSTCIVSCTMCIHTFVFLCVYMHMYIHVCMCTYIHVSHYIHGICASYCREWPPI